MPGAQRDIMRSNVVILFVISQSYVTDKNKYTRGSIFFIHSALILNQIDMTRSTNGHRGANNYNGNVNN